MILSLRESLETCKGSLATCQTELQTAKSEIQRWRSAFENESFIPAGASLEPKLVINYLQTLKSSDELLREQLEKAKKKEAAFIVTFAKREQEIAELKTYWRTDVIRKTYAQIGLNEKSMIVDLPGLRRHLILLYVYPEPYLMEFSCCLIDRVHRASARWEYLALRLKTGDYKFVNLIEEKDKKVKELQDNIAAVNFTPQSKMGKMLMAKCRTLQEENEEIGNQAAEGKMHELAMKLALQKSQNAELRSQFEGLYKHMEGLTDDVEKSNETVLLLQEKLEEKDQELKKLNFQLQQKTLVEEKTDTCANKTDSTDAINDTLFKKEAEVN
ncbi:unnamed protein product [Dovyalis caffra]|uniref:FKBP12-interacting protein of 37 kDa n=1 Tax=Dovyalis caffra TaxID=77055 RepID=A0AAV1SDZ9_9ROSI|nr:unnamed protein product [Dovyalis caffra]